MISSAGGRHKATSRGETNSLSQSAGYHACSAEGERDSSIRTHHDEEAEDARDKDDELLPAGLLLGVERDEHGHGLVLVHQGADPRSHEALVVTGWKQKRRETKQEALASAP